MFWNVTSRLSYIHLDYFRERDFCNFLLCRNDGSIEAVYPSPQQVYTAHWIFSSPSQIHFSICLQIKYVIFFALGLPRFINIMKMRWWQYLSSTHNLFYSIFTLITLPLLTNNFAHVSSFWLPSWQMFPCEGLRNMGILQIGRQYVHLLLWQNVYGTTAMHQHINRKHAGVILEGGLPENEKMAWADRAVFCHCFSVVLQWCKLTFLPTCHCSWWIPKSTSHPIFYTYHFVLSGSV